MMMTYLHCNQRLSLHLNLFNGEYFQFIRIPIKHWGVNNETQTKKTTAGRKVKVIKSDATIKSWLHHIRTTVRSQRLLANGTLPPIITQMFEFKFFLMQKLSPHSTTPPSPRAPPAGLSPPPQLPGPGHWQAGYLLPGNKQKWWTKPSATSWLQLE